MRSTVEASVIGAGTMGNGIAQVLAASGRRVHLVDVSRPALDNAVATIGKSLAKFVEKGKLAAEEKDATMGRLKGTVKDEDLADCDLIVEVIVENLAVKRETFARLDELCKPETIFASNTSGLSINRLAESLPEPLRKRFCGVHFFNPPRYMHLVELIAARDSDGGVLDALERFLVTTLGKGVIRAKDTPNFIANRVGVFSMLATVHHAERFGIGFDVVDALTGALIGRPRSARTTGRW